MAYTTAQPGDSLTIKDIEESIRLLGLDKPHPIGIWFIDCAKEYYAFRNILYKHFYDIFLSPFSIPVYEWYLRFWNDGEYKPPFGDNPGIWLEMSDGNHVKFELSK